jgi:hypothetical protein
MAVTVVADGAMADDGIGGSSRMWLLISGWRVLALVGAANVCSGRCTSNPLAFLKVEERQ